MHIVAALLSFLRQDFIKAAVGSLQVVQRKPDSW